MKFILQLVFSECQSLPKGFSLVSTAAQEFCDGLAINTLLSTMCKHFSVNRGWVLDIYCTVLCFLLLYMSLKFLIGMGVLLITMGKG